MSTESDQPEDRGLRNATVYGFEPLEWQDPFIHTTAREVLGSGAFGSGKSRALNERGVLLSIAYPGNIGLLTRNTLKALRNTTLENLRNEVLPRSWIIPELTNQQKQVIAIQSPLYPASYCPECGHESERRTHEETVECPACHEALLEAVPASLIYYDGLQTTDDADIPENILSLELGWIGVDEAKDIEESAWKALNGRLRLERLNNPYVPELPFRTIFGTTNPADPNHWLHKRFYEDGVGEYYESETTDNLANLPDDYLQTLKEQYGEDTSEALRYIRGKWTGYSGLVFDEFKDEIHLVEPLDVPEILGDGWTVANEEELEANEQEVSEQVGVPNKPGQYTPARVYPPEDASILMAIDWGYRPDPLVVQWWALTETHGFVLYREWFKSRVLPDDAARECMDLMEPYECNNVVRCYADHDSGDRESWLKGAREYVNEGVEEGRWEGDTSKPDWRRVQTTAAAKDREKGVQEVKRRMRPDKHNRAEVHLVKGARAHQIDRQLNSADKPGRTLAEIRGYGYEDEDSDNPQDGNDHGVDTMRYCIYSHRKKGRTSGSGSSVIKS